MWTRKELKDKAKVSFKANYWKTVFVALVLMALIGGMSIYSSASSAVSSATRSNVAALQNTPNDVSVEVKDGKVKVDAVDDDGRKVHVNLDADEIENLDDALHDAGVDVEDARVLAALPGPGLVIMGLSLSLLMLIALAIAIALYVFVLSPLEVGAQRFFIRNLNQRSEVKEIAFGYDNNYKETVKTLFLRSLFIFLWALLFIIPGIYKSYEYRMIPYLLAEDSTMTKDRAFAESKRMMDGQKWNTFVLDLSFLGWNILSAMTLGILGVFYVTPYQVQTNAALYEKLRYGLPAPEQVAQATPVAPVAPMAATYAPVEGMQTQPVAANAPMQTAPMAQAQAATVPVIVPESQPPIPPFAQVGAVPEAGIDANATAPEPEAEVEADVAATALVPEPESEAGTTVPIPESGIDPTAPMPETGENGADSDSPDA